MVTMFKSDYLDSPIKVEKFEGYAECECCGAMIMGCNVCDDCLNGDCESADHCQMCNESDCTCD